MVLLDAMAVNKGVFCLQINRHVNGSSVAEFRDKDAEFGPTLWDEGLTVGAILFFHFLT